ncbi:hypothetical protein [Vibrio owensii]|uniref:hypothetical protein n=1 Tax=Vibrio harveyi group TaxID=717610 RepID=UPI003CC5CCCD
MATQGLLSIVKNNVVLAKIVAGCNGDEIAELLYKVRTTSDYSSNNLFKLARSVAFGGSDSLVVMARESNEVMFAENADMTDQDKSHYLETFNNPEWNPRWRFGTADYVEVINL